MFDELGFGPYLDKVLVKERGNGFMCPDDLVGIIFQLICRRGRAGLLSSVVVEIFVLIFI